MQQKQTNISMENIKQLVDNFYQQIKKDDLIGPIFMDHIQNDWAKHLDKMYRFWQTILLEEATYFGSPFPPHIKMKIDHTHFGRWLGLWSSAVDELFEGEKATEIKWRAGKMVELFESKLALYKDQNFKDLL